MEKNFKCISTFKISEFNTYTFVICKELKKNIEYITKLLNLDKVPKKLFDDYKLKSDFEKNLYTDNFEVSFIGLGGEGVNKCDNNNLYKTFGRLGRSVHHQNKKYFIHLIENDINIIKNQIVSYILGYYNFNEFKSDKIKDKTKICFYHPKKKIIKEVTSAIY